MLARKALAGTAGAPKLYVEDVMSCFLYTGNGSTQTITNNIDLSTEGGLVWIKKRDSAVDHVLQDTERGTGVRLTSNTTNGNVSDSTCITAFNNNGFALGSTLNSNAATYVSWAFRQAKKFFDVVTYTGTGSARTVSHNLGSVPGCIIIKQTNTSGADWAVFHRSQGKTKYGLLNTTAAFASDAGNTRWNNTDPTSTDFTVGSDTEVNANGSTYVAYLFAHDAGGFGDAGSDNVISCGSFSTTTTWPKEVNLGYEPQWILVKRTSSTGNWVIWDTMRGMSLTGASDLAANSSSAEGTGDYCYAYSQGFGIKTGGLPASSDYIYIAIRRGPMKTPTSGTSVFTPVAYTGNGTARTTVTDIVTDLSIIKKRNTTYAPSLEDRLRGANQVLESNSTGAEIATSQYILGFDVQNGVRIGTDVGVNESSSTFINWAFRRAPGFFDVVCYNGTGVNRTVSHNLGAVPELIIVKARDDGTSPWRSYAAALGATKYLDLNSTAAETTSSTPWNDTAPTSSVFTVGTSSRTNDSALKYVAYLFASVSGVSKVGSYTGNGSSVTVTTGFQPRFILVKRTDSTGDWIVSDSARGLVAGNDPYLLLNSSAAEDTDEDWVDISSTGFTVNQTTAANANVNTGTYIYLAIA